GTPVRLDAPGVPELANGIASRFGYSIEFRRVGNENAQDRSYTGSRFDSWRGNAAVEGTAFSDGTPVRFDAPGVPELANGIASRFGYSIEFRRVGNENAQVGASVRLNR